MDAERVREIVDKIRSSLPQEIRQAKAIVSDRSQIIADAKREAETVVRVSRGAGPGDGETRMRSCCQAQARGSELLSQSPDQGQRNPPGRQRVCGRPDEAYGRTDDRQFSGAEENPAKSEGVSEIGQPVMKNPIPESKAKAIRALARPALYLLNEKTPGSKSILPGVFLPKGRRFKFLSQTGSGISPARFCERDGLK